MVGDAAQHWTEEIAVPWGLTMQRRGFFGCTALELAVAAVGLDLLRKPAHETEPAVAVAVAAGCTRTLQENFLAFAFDALTSRY